MLKNKEYIKKIFVVILISVMSGIIFFYQTKKVGFHEDESYTLCSAVNPTNGLMAAYDDWESSPVWRTKEYVKDFMTLTPNNILNFKALYMNQAYDNHPPLFYTLVHFSSILFGGQFNIYTVFVVNIIAFIFSCLIITKILKLLNKEHLTIPTLIFYGLSMGTISMVIFQRMYMLLTLFIMLYFYLSLKLYKNDFVLDKKLNIQLGITTILGFLTQYFFAIYAFFIFIIMIIEMIRKKKDKKLIIKYAVCHIIYAAIGILLFVPCIKHLLFSDRGLTNLGNSNYFGHMFDYIKHLSYAFTINNTNNILMFSILILFAISTISLIIKSKEKFIPLITIVPSIFYFFIAVKMTSFQELRYIMAVIPFIVLTIFFILDEFINIKYKEILFIAISIILILPGFIFSKPKFLYENYENALNIANENSEKSFVYVYDNIFNHMQSIPEMMIYEKTLIINTNRDELQYVINDDELNSEDSYILCIKSYMDNDSILSELKNNTDFKNVTELYKTNESSTEIISNNLYLMSKESNTSNIIDPKSVSNNNNEINEGELRTLLEKYLAFSNLNADGTPLLCSYDSDNTYGLQLYKSFDEMYADISDSNETVIVNGEELPLVKTSIKFSTYKNALLEYISEELFEKQFMKYCKNVDGILHIVNAGSDGKIYIIQQMEQISNNDDIVSYKVNCKYYEGESSEISKTLLVNFKKGKEKYIIYSCEF